MKPIVSCLAGGLLLAASSGAHAQATVADTQLRMDRGFYVGAGIGKSRLSGEDCIGICDLSDRSWNVYAGYHFNRNFALEAGYADLGEATMSVMLIGGAGTASAVIQTKALELVGVALLPFTDAFAVYLKAGIFRSDAKSVSFGVGAGSGREKDTNFTVAAGVQYSFTPNFAARFEWQNYNDVGTGAIGIPPQDIRVWRLGARAKF